MAAGFVPSVLGSTVANVAYGTGKNVVEYLDRGISAVNTGSGMLVSWRFLADDADNTVYRLYRDNQLVYTSNSGNATCYLDKGGKSTSSYRVDTIVGENLVSSDECTHKSNTNYLTIPMDIPKAGSGYTYSPNDCSVGDVDGDGNHNCMPADVDNDGKQELLLGAVCLDDNGKVLWCNNLGHGDAMHLSDLLPDRPGLELWVCHEVKPYGVSLLDAATGTGKKIFHYDHEKDTGRCAAGNIYAGNPGAEFWVHSWELFMTETDSQLVL